MEPQPYAAPDPTGGTGMRVKIKVARLNVTLRPARGSRVTASNGRTFVVVSEVAIPARACVTNILVRATFGLWPFGRYVWLDAEGVNG